MAPNTDSFTRTLIVTLKSPPVGKSTSQISELTGVNPRTVDRIYSRAIAAGFEPNVLPLKILPHHVQDASRSGRPAKQTEEKTCADVAGGLSLKGVEISASTVWRVLREAGYKKTKPTRKPGLTQEMRSARLKWAIDHRDWTLEDWKNVIWTDETSVVINHRRGGYRIWRRADERVVKSCIRERWKGYSEFMFWGCFSYDKKGPCYFYQPETKAEREDAACRIEQLNAELEPLQREEWELSESMRTGLRNKRGRKPQWRWTEKTGKLLEELFELLKSLSDKDASEVLGRIRAGAKPQDIIESVKHGNMLMHFASAMGSSRDSPTSSQVGDRERSRSGSRDNEKPGKDADTPTKGS
ncbi:HTH-Tnp-Tc3-2 domain containing protein [Pyrenophora tritici-repentis]|uniref:HTH-Tnp-Tc3-2 domain containing protein n=1 Tax=Pyrenophora tritici-repentis TaxID=45151 RepID=A0A922T3E8_9PLEO|nr:HTH-Tnp-Tc3-2 domain containing protein [Pyrenophora tritici-repentis]